MWFILLLQLTLPPSNHFVELGWQLSSCPDPAYQTMWRQKECTGQFLKRKKLKAVDSTWIDTLVRGGKKYCYAVTVTDVNNQTSDFSNIVEADIPE